MVNTKKLKLFLNSFIPPIAWALLIFYFSSQQVLPSFEASLHDYIFKKIAHIFVYAVLYYLLYRAVERSFHSKKTYIYAFIICLIYAVSDEIHQSFTPGRYATLRDIGYDMIGSSITTLLLFRYI